MELEDKTQESRLCSAISGVAATGEGEALPQPRLHNLSRHLRCRYIDVNARVVVVVVVFVVVVVVHSGLIYFFSSFSYVFGLNFHWRTPGRWLGYLNRSHSLTASSRYPSGLSCPCLSG